MREIRLFIVIALLPTLTVAGWSDGGIEYLKNMQAAKREIYRSASPSVVRVQLVHRSMPAFLLSKLNRRASECEIDPWFRGEISNEEAALWRGWCQSFVDFADQKFLPSVQSDNETVDWEKSLADVYDQWIEMVRVEMEGQENAESLDRFSEKLSAHVAGLGEELKTSSVISPKPLVRDQSSGVVIREGYVVTTMNIAKRHGPDDWIRVWSDTEVAFSTGEIVGVDPHTNLAVIRLATRNSTLAPPIGVNLDVKPEVGDFVFSFYHPFNQGLSMQTGEITSLYNQLPFFQCAAFHGTSFPTSPGSLGGPIVDLDGNLVGINTIFMSQGNMSEITYAL
ncbi:MAG: trypsin-like peptidase domain-containing protein, partial [Candidatus Omnitrophica bacterium]|nr:trypsin-like peptidase domain-containing protein [Candidatus Omnitrophota bacterium]